MRLYNPEFVKMILDSHKSMMKGKRTRINVEELWIKDYQKKEGSTK